MSMLPERERIIRASIQGVGEDTFPDDAVEWRVISIRHVADYSLVEVEVDADPRIGYPRFAFVIYFGGEKMQDCACYCLDCGTWKLLCTSPGTPTDWRALGVAP
jgi:hypothetical protein